MAAPPFGAPGHLLIANLSRLAVDCYLLVENCQPISLVFSKRFLGGNPLRFRTQERCSEARATCRLVSVSAFGRAPGSGPGALPGGLLVSPLDLALKKPWGVE